MGTPDQEYRRHAKVAEETVAEVARRAAMHAAARYESYNLITSCGEAATQSVRHLHWHVVPRRIGDGLHLPWTGQVTT